MHAPPAESTNHRALWTPSEEAILSVPLLAAIPAAARGELALRMRRHVEGAGRTLVWYGEPGDSFSLIVRGRVSVSVPSGQGRHREITQLGPGEFFGETALLDGGLRTATVRTTEETELLSLGRDDFLAVLRSRPEAAIAVLAELSARQRVNLELLRQQPNPAMAYVDQDRSMWHLASVRVAKLASDWRFALAHLLVYGSWFAVNVLAEQEVLPRWMLFDEPYKFDRLKLMLGLEGIFLSMFLLASQKTQSARDRLKAELDHEVNLKSQTEIQAIARKVEAIERAVVGAEVGAGVKLGAGTQGAAAVAGAPTTAAAR